MAVFHLTLLAALRQLAGNPDLSLVVRDGDGAAWYYTKDLEGTTPGALVVQAATCGAGVDGGWWVEETF